MEKVAGILLLPYNCVGLHGNQKGVLKKGDRLKGGIKPDP